MRSGQGGASETGNTPSSPYSSLTVALENPEEGFLSRGTDEGIVGMQPLKNFLHSADSDTVPTLGQIGGQAAVGIRRGPYGPFPRGAPSLRGADSCQAD